MGAGDGKTSAKKNALAFMVDRMKKMKRYFCMIMEHQPEI